MSKQNGLREPFEPIVVVPIFASRLWSFLEDRQKQIVDLRDWPQHIAHHAQSQLPGGSMYHTGLAAVCDVIVHVSVVDPPQ